MPRQPGKWDDEGLTLEQLKKQRRELTAIVRELLNDPGFKPPLVSNDNRTNPPDFSQYLIEFFEERSGSDQSAEGLYFHDVAGKIPHLPLAKVIEDFEKRQEVFQDTFRVEMINVGSPHFYAHKI